MESAGASFFPRSTGPARSVVCVDTLRAFNVLLERVPRAERVPVTEAHEVLARVVTATAQ
jgi:hypothetical protein